MLNQKEGKATHVMQTPKFVSGFELKLFKTTQSSISMCYLTQHQDDLIIS